MPHLSAGARQNLCASIAMIVLTALAVIARFGVKLSRRQRPVGADWMCLFSVPLFYAHCGLILRVIFNTSPNGSFSITALQSTPKLKEILQINFTFELLFIFVITPVKLSILWFYYSLFATKHTPIFNRVARGSAVICILWMLGMTFAVVFQCYPVATYWNVVDELPACFHTARLLLGQELTNFFLDILILCIPVPMVWKLNLDSSKKTGVSGIFLLGGFVCVTSIARMTAIWRPPNVEISIQKHYPMIMLWSTLQLGVAITCACLPTLGPLLPFIKIPLEYLGKWIDYLWPRSQFQASSRGHKVSDHSSHQRPSGGQTPTGPFYGSSRCWARGNVHESCVENDVEEMPLRTIMVNRDVEVIQEGASGTSCKGSQGTNDSIQLQRTGSS